jgi:dTDP-4-dehydrorhamnose reductase
MKVLVLGASGFLGGRVYQRLKADKHFEVKGTCFKSSENNDLFRFNVNNEDEVKYLLHEFTPDVIIWCLMDMKNERLLTDFGLNYMVGNITDSTKFIYITTDAFVEGKGNYSENAAIKYYSNSNPLSGYVNAKIDGERIVCRLENYILVRTGPLYGQNAFGNWDKRISALIDSLSQNKSIIRTSNLYKTFVNADDQVEFINEVIQSNYRGLIHVGPGEKESYYTFNIKMAKHLGLDDKLIIEDIIDIEHANENGIPLDTSMNTSKCRQTFKTKFRSV